MDQIGTRPESRTANLDQPLNIRTQISENQQLNEQEQYRLFPSRGSPGRRTKNLRKKQSEDVESVEEGEKNEPSSYK